MATLYVQRTRGGADQGLWRIDGKIVGITGAFLAALGGTVGAVECDDLQWTRFKTAYGAPIT